MFIKVLDLYGQVLWVNPADVRQFFDIEIAGNDWPKPLTRLVFRGAGVEVTLDVRGTAAEFASKADYLAQPVR